MDRAVDEIITKIASVGSPHKLDHLSCLTAISHAQREEIARQQGERVQKIKKIAGILKSRRVSLKFKKLHTVIFKKRILNWPAICPAL